MEFDECFELALGDVVEFPSKDLRDAPAKVGALFLEAQDT
jgi:hypothetical protein